MKNQSWIHLFVLICHNVKKESLHILSKMPLPEQLKSTSGKFLAKLETLFLNNMIVKIHLCLVNL